MRHSHARITLGVYRHVLVDAQRRADDRGVLCNLARFLRSGFMLFRVFGCHSERRDATLLSACAKRTSRPKVEESLLHPSAPLGVGALAPT
jgi:hypothetical protein